MKFIVIGKHKLLILLTTMLVIGYIFAIPSVHSSIPKTSITILLDPGHGGIDGGSVGKLTGKDENFLNLEYANVLKKMCEDFGFNIVMTRENLNGLYSPFAKNKKKDDMAKRKAIIEKVQPDLIISIHMNSFPISSSRGAQVFYKQNCVAGKALADSIQNVFVETLPKARKQCQVGDYYILNCSNIPSVIVECGFLSNAEEESLLVSEDYKNSVCLSIFYGVLAYLGK